MVDKIELAIPRPVDAEVFVDAVELDAEPKALPTMPVTRLPIPSRPERRDPPDTASTSVLLNSRIFKLHSNDAGI